MHAKGNRERNVRGNQWRNKKAKALLTANAWRHRKEPARNTPGSPRGCVQLKAQENRNRTQVIQRQCREALTAESSRRNGRERVRLSLHSSPVAHQAVYLQFQ